MKSLFSSTIELISFRLTRTSKSNLNRRLTSKMQNKDFERIVTAQIQSFIDKRRSFMHTQAAGEAAATFASLFSLTNTLALAPRRQSVKVARRKRVAPVIGEFRGAAMSSLKRAAARSASVMFDEARARLKTANVQNTESAAIIVEQKKDFQRSTCLNKTAAVAQTAVRLLQAAASVATSRTCAAAR